jgi:hypothetical protein
MKHLLSSLVVLGVSACNAVLGYNEATVDPNLPADGDAGTTTQAFTCDAYCANITKNCTGDQTEYLNVDICKGMCSHFELGPADHVNGDTLSCRSYHAISAAQDPTTHCKHAGPTGGGHCGSDPCIPFCALDAALCADGNNPYPGGELACRTAYVNYTYKLGPTDVELLVVGATLNCRLWHLESAYDPNNPVAKTTHCPHTGQTSTTCF